MEEKDIISVLQLRQAGGKYYLIDNKNAGMPYHKPIIVNETGAEMFRLLSQYEDVETAATVMAESYCVDRNMLQRDMELFVEDIKRSHIVWQ